LVIEALKGNLEDRLRNERIAEGHRDFRLLKKSFRGIRINAELEIRCKIRQAIVVSRCFQTLKSNYVNGKEVDDALGELADLEYKKLSFKLFIKRAREMIKRTDDQAERQFIESLHATS
jgi:hypothetical protein